MNLLGALDTLLCIIVETLAEFQTWSVLTILGADSEARPQLLQELSPNRLWLPGLRADGSKDGQRTRSQRLQAITFSFHTLRP